MDHEALCDCQFVDTCPTFADKLIREARKGPDGLGCRERNDHYRARHCRTFACAYLSAVVSDVLRHPAPGPAAERE